MRTFIFVVAVVLSASLTSLGGLVTALELRDAPTGLAVATTTAVAAFVFGPLVIGSLAGYWDPAASDEGRRILRRWTAWVIAIDVAGAVVVVVTSVVAGAALALPIALIVGAAVLLAVAREPAKPTPIALS